MKKFIALSALITFAFAISLPELNGQIAFQPAINHKLIHDINSKGSSWEAGVNTFLEGKTMAEAKKLLGWKPNPNKIPAPRVSKIVAGLPTNYDASQEYPKCNNIGTIYNQADCGSCWAFGCVESAQDRLCIQTQAAQNIELSFFDLVTCDQNDDGCDGGDPETAWYFVTTSGLVTATCSPYDIPTCPPQQQPCLNFVNTPPCPSSCNDTEKWTPYVFDNYYSVNADQDSIMSDIYTNGPVEACFTVYQDFLAYKSGVYQQTSDDALGGHCIKIIGWGVDTASNLPYWLCNNSWTTYWGDNGQFKILRGQDECGIEDEVVGGIWRNSTASAF